MCANTFLIFDDVQVFIAQTQGLAVDVFVDA